MFCPLSAFRMGLGWIRASHWARFGSTLACLINILSISYRRSIVLHASVNVFMYHLNFSGINVFVDFLRSSFCLIITFGIYLYIYLFIHVFNIFIIYWLIHYLIPWPVHWFVYWITYSINFMSNVHLITSLFWVNIKIIILAYFSFM